MRGCQQHPELPSVVKLLACASSCNGVYDRHNVPPACGGRRCLRAALNVLAILCVPQARRSSRCCARSTWRRTWPARLTWTCCCPRAPPTGACPTARPKQPTVGAPTQRAALAPERQTLRRLQIVTPAFDHSQGCLLKRACMWPRRVQRPAAHRAEVQGQGGLRGGWELLRDERDQLVHDQCHPLHNPSRPRGAAAGQARAHGDRRQRGGGALPDGQPAHVVHSERLLRLRRLRRRGPGRRLRHPRAAGARRQQRPDGRTPSAARRCVSAGSCVL